MTVYLISAQRENNKVYKIGYTRREINQRLKELKTGNCDVLTIESFFKTKWATKIESVLHKIFEKSKIDGEWFELSESQIVDFLTICQKTHDNIELINKYNTWAENKGGISKIK
jgi:hypothetical protein